MKSYMFKLNKTTETGGKRKNALWVYVLIAFLIIFYMIFRVL